MSKLILTIKEEGGCELYNMYKSLYTGKIEKEELVLRIGGDERIFIDFDNKQVMINGVIIFSE